jgi:hypothetical protein
MAQCLMVDLMNLCASVRKWHHEHLLSLFLFLLLLLHSVISLGSALGMVYSRPRVYAPNVTCPNLTQPSLLGASLTSKMDRISSCCIRSSLIIL